MGTGNGTGCARVSGRVDCELIMDIQLIDDRKAERTITTIDHESLSDNWQDVKDFIERSPNSKFTLRLEPNANGKMFVSSDIAGNKGYDLVVLPNGKVKYC